MGLFDLFSNGGVTTSADNTTTSGLMERLSLENGWTPDAREQNCIAHFFKGDAITPRRDVIIAYMIDDNYFSRPAIMRIPGP